MLNARSVLFSSHSRQIREATFSENEHFKIHSNFSPALLGLRVEVDDDGISKGYYDGIPQICGDQDVRIRVFGTGLTTETSIKFTTNAASRELTVRNFRPVKFSP